MEFDRFGDDADPDLLFVLGWGNRPSHAPVRWLLDHLSHDYHVHTATLPAHVTDVTREWVRPVEDYAADLDEPAVLAHSAGGLTVAHADLDARTTTYLSPWWGFPPATESPLLDLLAKLPTDRRFLPSSIDDTQLLGEHATAQQIADAPDLVSPRFIRAVRRAHSGLPDAREDAACFCSLSDRVVSTRAIGDRLDSDQIRLYDGGHELFSSRSREDHIETLLAALEDGIDALA
ncbi:alpha/beta fold hydrolase [Halapricum salinum]|uniref:Alpha/beta hydrolase n=1 Tax=Halapricum salinum TaxID=1457250 RepID=A0A4D6HB24_9EURY|nr:alpha/beta fold hydrolase [Halapricum salinum]QCC51183.1 alpha/beta hydrolase [Halapricum salinum]